MKARVVPMRGGGKKAAALHVRYIERDGVERDGSPGRMYGAAGAVESARFAETLAGEKHQFRLIISPEDAGELELTEYVRRLMAQVEADTGRELEWGAVNHYDTDNPHAHVVVRGVDREGRAVRLDREYIANGLRRRAQEIATEELGPRPAVAIAEQRLREVEQDRLTTLDRELGRLSVSGHVDVVSLRREGRAQRSRELLVARLGHLKDLGLATRESTMGWTLVPGWQERLRELGERGDVIKQMHRALRGDPGRYHVVRAGQPLPRVHTEPERVYGRVVAKVLADELKGSVSAVVETPSGAGYHVPLDVRTADMLREGDLVRITARLKAWAEAGSQPAVRLFVDRERPLHEQVHHRGPVWLDELPAGFIALHGFGAEVLRAAAARREVLRGLGIDPTDRDRRVKLAEVERRTREEQAKRRRPGKERGS